MNESFFDFPKTEHSYDNYDNELLPIIQPPDYLSVQNLKKSWDRLTEDEKLDGLLLFSKKLDPDGNKQLYQFLVNQGRFLDHLINYENTGIREIKGLTYDSIKATWDFTLAQPQRPGTIVNKVKFLTQAQLIELLTK